MKKKGFDTGVHGLRGMAALIVFLFHCYDIPRKMDVFPEVHRGVAFVFELGAVGVDVFFIISGYLITSSLIRHGNIRSFFVDRIARIYPLFLFIHFLIFPIGPFIGYKWMQGLGVGEWGLHFISNALLLPGVFDLPLLQLNAWSLSYEVFFYLISAFLYLLFFRSRALFYSVGMVLVLMTVCFYPRSIFFVVGVGAYLVELHFPGKSWFLSYATSFLSFLLFFISMGFALKGGHHELFYIAAVPGYLFFSTVLRGSSWLHGVLLLRPVQFLGDISYSFYLWHAVVAFPLKVILFKFGVFRYGLPLGLALCMWFIFFLGVTLLISYFSKLYIEDVGRRWVKRIFEARRRVALSS